jgi:hypothetical protein
MTTTQKIIFTPAPQDTTASASQNRESETPKEVTFPAPWISGRTIEVKSGLDPRRQALANAEATWPPNAPTKPAHAHAASAHTPGPWEVTQNYKGGIPLSVKRVGENCTVARVDWLPDGSGKPSAVCQANARLIAAAPETAAERDRLKEQVSHFTKHRDPRECEEIEHERDQAREQVKTLLAACKRVGDRVMWRSLNGELAWRGETPDGNEIETQHPVSILQAAIASVESEGQ